MKKLSTSPRNALIILGGGALVYLTSKVLRILVLWSQLGLGPVNVKKFKGDWAVVTGASGGIGEALAQSVAAHGVNIIMVARSPEKLSRAAARLQMAHPGVATRTIVQDMAADGAADAVCKQLDDVSVSLLLCSADDGAPTRPRPLWHFTPAEQEHVRRLHGESTYGLVRGLVPRMVERGKGAVVAISSSAARAPAYMTPYGAEHAKVTAFMEGLAGELHGTGVTAQAAVLDPMLLHDSQTSTEASNAAQSPSVPSPHPDTVAHGVMRHIGRGGPTFTPFAGQALQDWLLASAWPGGLQGVVHRRARQQYRVLLGSAKERPVKAAQAREGQRPCGWL